MLKKILLIVSLCSLVGISPSYAAKDEAASVAASSEKLRALMVDPDKAKLDALVFKDLSYGHSGGKVDTKEVFIDDLMTGVSDFVSIKVSDETVKVLGDTALVRHTMACETANKGQPPGSITMKILYVWKKQAGKWMLVARQSVRMP